MHTAIQKGMIATIARARRSALPVLVGLLTAATITSCGSDSQTAPLVAASIVITTPSGAVPVTGTMQFVAIVKDAHGNVIALSPTWSVVNGGGTITAGGLFTAGDSAGTFVNTIKATSGAVSSLSSVTVSAGALASITVTPSSDTLAIDATQQYTAVGKDAHNNVVAITPTWSVVAGGGTVDSAGLFTAGTTAGAFPNTVQATSGAVSGTGSVVITPGLLATVTLTPDSVSVATGATQQYTAVGRDAHNNVVPFTPIWSVVAGGGTIDSTGLFTADTTAGSYPGTVRVAQQFHCSVISATATVVVNPGPVVRITVSPSNPTVLRGASQQFTAVGYDAYDNVSPFTPTWAALDTAGTISSTGLFTASNTANGSYTKAITAIWHSILGWAAVTVDCGC